MFNLADLFERVCDVVPDRTALVCGDRRLSYRALDEAADRLGHHLSDAGVAPGDRVAMQLHNGVEYVVALLATLKARAVPVNVNYRYLQDELRYLLTDAAPAALVVDVEFLPRVSAVLGEVGSIRHVLVVGGDGSGGTSFEDAVAGGRAGRRFPPRSGDDLYVIYTGGTTGMPKGVMWRQEDLFFAGMGGGDPVGEPARSPEEVQERARTRYPMVMFPVAPLMHGAAQLATFIAFLQAQTVVLLPRFDAAEVVRAIERERVNTINIVGDAMARPIAEALGGPLAGADLSSLVAISSAGAILSPSVREQLSTLLPNTFVIDSFGATETGFNGMGVAGSAPGALRFQVNARTAVLDDDLRPVAPGSGRVGRVAQRGHIPVGYLGDPDKTAATFVEVAGVRWVLLGDLARVEEDGTLTVLGRGSQCINTGGEKVFPEEVEAVLKAHPAVFDAVVAGVPDEAFGERVAAVVQLRAGPPVADADIDRHCRGHLAGYKVPRAFVRVDRVERSPSGKPDYPWARRVLGGS